MQPPSRLTILTLAVAAAIAPAANSQGVSPAAGTNSALTIYSTAAPGAIPPELYRNGNRGGAVPGYGVVRTERELALARGRNTVRYTDVAAFIDPTTVQFESLTDAAGTGVIEQNFQFDLVSQQKLLERYIDRKVTVDQVRGNQTETFNGTLLSMAGGMVLKRDDGSLQLLPHNSGVRLPDLPGGLITKPTLVWDINAARAGTHRTRVSYQTSGLTWWADYNLTYSEGKTANQCKLDVGAWVSILNQSGASYPEAKLKLVAGDVQRVAPVGRSRRDAAYPAAAEAMQNKAAGFQEKDFFEYHLYTLGRPTTLPDNSTKQIELFPVARTVPCEKTLVYYGLPPGSFGFFPSPMTDRNYGTATNKKVDVYLGFRNGKEQNLGIPLPSGRVRVAKRDDADGTLEFIGEDTIDHTPRNEDVRVKLGSAFDIVGERKQLDFKADGARQLMTEEIEVRLRNRKKEAVTVLVKENLYRWTNWRITAKTHDFRKEDSRTIVFPVQIAAGAEAVVRYSVQYYW
ncbi:MAG: DUF4139 domain-containing protein [Burkholderiales bacterium]